jgi:uncharacterized protein (TIGR02722 family)
MISCSIKEDQKMKLPQTVFALSLLLSITLLTSCGGNRAFTKGEYDDPTRVALLDDKFNESDMQQMAESIVKAMVACERVAKSPSRPVAQVEQVQNRTEEHIDMVSMTDKIRTALIKSGKVRFINKTERGTVEDEMQYQEGGNVSAETKKKRGKQIGADLILSGVMSTNIQQVGNDKLIYYKLTMNMTNLETNEIECTEDREVRKKYRKQSVGM